MILNKTVRQLWRLLRALPALGTAAALAAWSSVGCPVAAAIDLEVRLVCDLTGTCSEGDFFFDHPEALETLHFATQAFRPFADTLSAVTVSPVATFQNPDTGAVGFGISNLVVPAETVIVYAGARDLADNRVGEAVPGSPLGTFDRGQGVTVGAGATDFAPWGGAIAFDNTESSGSARNWHFAVHQKPPPGSADFLTVALHELAHLFGFGTASSFTNQVVDREFTGIVANAIYGSDVPLFTDDRHWDNGVTSPPNENEPRASLGPSLALGRRTLLSSIDYAALADIGWEVPSQLLGLHGDADDDRDVDGGDFLAWQRGSGLSNVSALLGDLSGDATVDNYDLWLWTQSYGATATANAVATDAVQSAAVPEPGAAVLLALTAGTWLAARRPLKPLAT